MYVFVMPWLGETIEPEGAPVLVKLPEVNPLEHSLAWRDQVLQFESPYISSNVCVDAKVAVFIYFFNCFLFLYIFLCSLWVGADYMLAFL